MRSKTVLNISKFGSVQIRFPFVIRRKWHSVVVSPFNFNSIAVGARRARTLLNYPRKQFKITLPLEIYNRRRDSKGEENGKLSKLK